MRRLRQVFEDADDSGDGNITLSNHDFGRIPDALQDAVVSGDPFHASFQGQRIELRCFASAPVSLRLIDMFLCLRQVWVFFVANIQYGVCFDPVVPNSVAGHDMTVRDLLCIWGPDPDEDIVI